MRFVITAGPTREPIDPVRYLSNRSSGRMGYAIAEAAVAAGHEVVLISGPVNLDCPRGVKSVSIITGDEMFDAVHERVNDCDILVMCAAVTDFKPKQIAKEKIKKRDAELILELVPTRDILASLTKQGRQYVVVGFAAETENIESNARAKLLEKNCDIVVANDARIAMESDENEVKIFVRGDKTETISRAAKKIIARELVKIFENVVKNVLTKKTE